VRGRPWRVVAVQATLSTAAILIVYLTLLRADGGQPLYEVEAPGGIEGRQELPRAEPDRKVEFERSGIATPARTAAAGLGPGPFLVASGPDAPSQEPPDDGRTPASDQYSGTISLIRARVSEAVE